VSSVQPRIQPRLIVRFVATMLIELACQVLLRPNQITVIAVWRKKLLLAFPASRHRGNLAFASQDDELAGWHGLDSLA
jgi:hypothetical protein